jgi:hypothetical protein
MSGILKRTVFVDGSDGYVRPHEFNLVMTGVGPCIEPTLGIFVRGLEPPGTTDSTFDATDDIARVDEIKPFSLDKQGLILGHHVHGGMLIPRTGR